MKNKEETAVAVTNQFTSVAELKELWNDFLADTQGLDLKPDRIKIPAGGVTVFELESDDEGGTENVKDIVGVISYQHPSFSYYKDPYSGGNNPPDCCSFDGVNGTGNPGGTCANCPYNQFGSGEGQAKACKNRRMIYIVREGELLPIMLNLPTGSLKEFSKYVKRQLTKRRKLNQIVTKISLKKATSSSGIAYSQAVFTFVRELNSEELESMKAYTELVKSFSMTLTTESLAGEVNEDAGPMVDPETGEIITPLGQ